MKFIQISIQRSGTTYLADLLDSHPNIYMSRELFKVDNNMLNVDSNNYRYFIDDYSVEEFLDNYYKQYEKDYSAVGFTIMLDHLKKFPEVLEYIKRNSVKCIYLERKDKIKIAFSRFKARKTGIYHTKKTIKNEVQISIDFDDLINELDKITSSIDELNLISNELGAYKILYEDLNTNQQNVLSNIQKYLTLSTYKNLHTTLKKTSNNIQKEIKNYHELMYQLKYNNKYKDLIMNEEKLKGYQGGGWDEETHLKLHSKNFNHGMADFIVNKIKPKNFLEFGSGLGFLAKYLDDNINLEQSYCIEPNKIKGVYENMKNIELLQLNIFKDNIPNQINYKFDMVISIEVAEHIERNKHNELFDFLVNHTNNWIVFSGARIGQGGHGHIAERDEEDWKSEFLIRGMIFDERLTENIRNACDKKNINHRRNIMVFYKETFLKKLKRIFIGK